MAAYRRSVKWLYCAMFVLVSLCVAFSDADIEFDFVLMTSAYSQAFGTNLKLIRYQGLSVYDDN